MTKKRRSSVSGRDFDREFRAQVAQMTSGLAPTAFTTAWADWAMHLAQAPAKQRELQQDMLARTQDTWAFALRALAGEPVSPAEGIDGEADPRFKGGDWSKFPFNVYARAYQNAAALMKDAVRDVDGVTEYHDQLLEFALRMLLDASSPSNCLATNPELLALTQAEKGQNLVRGFKHWAEDLKRTLAGTAPVGADEFEVGKHVAVTPGKVVFRNELIELIQYEPTTKDVYAEPVLVVPAWIMKYYILDLSPRNSMIKYLVDQGHTVFAMSWKNPDERDREIGMDDYLRLGLFAALDAVTTIVPERKVHAVGYCIGGTLLSIGVAALARDGDERLASMTLFAAQTDFSEPGELAFFINPSQLAMLEATMHRKGVLESKQMGGAFALLRAKDLVWQPIVDTYLKGQRAPMIDLMAWNADGTRMPWKMHSEYLYLSRQRTGDQPLPGRRPAGAAVRHPPADAGGRHRGRPRGAVEVGLQGRQPGPLRRLHLPADRRRPQRRHRLRAGASEAALPDQDAPAGRPAPAAGGMGGRSDEARRLVVAGAASVAGAAFERQAQAAGDGRGAQGLRGHRGRAGRLRAPAIAAARRGASAARLRRCGRTTASTGRPRRATARPPPPRRAQ
jgi:polyhydroxyalkanoate synthase